MCVYLHVCKCESDKFYVSAEGSFFNIILNPKESEVLLN